MCTGVFCAGLWAVYARGQVYSTPAGMTMVLNTLSYTLTNLTEGVLKAYG